MLNVIEKVILQAKDFKLFNTDKQKKIESYHKNFVIGYCFDILCGYCFDMSHFLIATMIT